MTATSDDIKELAPALAEFLGKRGVRFFQLLHKFHDGIPLGVRVKGHIGYHNIHGTEGMQIRNFLRFQRQAREWTQHDLDNHWIDVVCYAIKRPVKIAKQRN